MGSSNAALLDVTDVWHDGSTYQFRGYRGDHIFDSLNKKKRFYERDALEFSSWLLRDETGLIVDVGANLGNHSVFYGGTRQNPLLAVEPYPANSELLQFNLRENVPSERWETASVAAWDASTKVKLDQSMQGNLGSFWAAESESGDIEAVPVDDLVGSRDVALLKIDVEGTEMRVIRGAQTVLDRSLPLVQAEAHGEASFWELNDELSGRGYLMVGIVGSSDNYVWVHPDRYPLQSEGQLSQQVASYWARRASRSLTRLEHGINKAR